MIMILLLLLLLMKITNDEDDNIKGIVVSVMRLTVILMTMTIII